MANLTGIYLVEYSLDAGGPGNIYDPKFLVKMEEFIAWYRQQPEVLHVNSILDIIKRLNKNMHGDDKNFYTIPESRELAAQYILMYELSLPYGLDLTSQINLDKSATRITVTLKGLKSSQMLALESRAQAWLDEHTKGSMMQTKGAAGAGLMFAHVGVENGKSMLIGNVWQCLIISAMLIIAIRSFKIGWVGIIPNMAPILMAYGVWGLIDGEINMAMSMVANISMGIVVDDTIHFMNQYMHGRRDLNMEPDEAIGYAFNFAGIPMWISTFTLVAGFSVLTLSHFAMNSDLGKLTAITIFFAAFTEAFMLPGLLLLIDRKGSKV